METFVDLDEILAQIDRVVRRLTEPTIPGTETKGSGMLCRKALYILLARLCKCCYTMKNEHYQQVATEGRAGCVAESFITRRITLIADGP